MANTWRTTEDFHRNWKSLLENVDLNNKFHSYAGPGGFNDPDMVVVGDPYLTPVQQKSHFTLWAVMKAPLLLSHDVPHTDQATMTIIGNKELIAINQDSLGVQGYRVKSISSDDGVVEVWAGPLAGGDIVVVLFNRSRPQPVSITAHWQDIGIPNDATQMKVHDLWQHKNSGVAKATYTATVPPQDVAAVRLSPVGFDSKNADIL